MKFKKEKTELLLRCRSWDTEGLQEIKDIVVEIKLASKAVKSTTMTWQPSGHIFQKGRDRTPTFPVRLTFGHSALTPPGTGFVFFPACFFPSPEPTASSGRAYFPSLHLAGSNPSSGHRLGLLETQSAYLQIWSVIESSFHCCHEKEMTVKPTDLTQSPVWS